MRQREVLFFLGSAVVVVFAWIAFTILHNSFTSTINGTVLQAIKPITPVFDTKILTEMKNRTVVIPLDTIPEQAQTAIVVTTAPTQPPLATSSGTIATQGGSTQ